MYNEYEQTLHQARLHRQREWSRYRDAAAAERRGLKRKYRQQRHLLAVLPVSVPDRKRLFQQLELRQAIETRALKQKHGTERWGIQKTLRPGTWRHFVASRAAQRDPARSDLCGRASGIAVFPAKKGSCEIQGDEAEL
ncbi:MAG: hypothetical protein WCE62_16230 [Polyangiales bacterium]